MLVSELLAMGFTQQQISLYFTPKKVKSVTVVNETTLTKGKQAIKERKIISYRDEIDDAIAKLIINHLRIYTSIKINGG